jgi:hypothetical protein
MSPSTPPLRPAAAPVPGTRQAAGCVGRHQHDSFHQSVADEDFASACLGLQPRTQRVPSPASRDRWRMIESFRGGARPTRRVSRTTSKSPTSPVETPRSMHMRRTIERLLPRVPSAPEADSQNHEVPRVVAWSQPETDGLAEIFKIQVHAKGIQHLTDEEECRHDARDASDKVCSAAGTPRRWSFESSTRASVEAAAVARDIFVDEAALLSNSNSKMKTATMPQTHIKPLRHVSRLLLSSLLQQTRAPPELTAEPAAAPSPPDARTCAADTPAVCHRTAFAHAVAAAFEAQGAAFAPAALPKSTQNPPLRPSAPTVLCRHTLSPASAMSTPRRATGREATCSEVLCLSAPPKVHINGWGQIQKRPAPSRSLLLWAPI